MHLLIATRNAHKTEEIAALLGSAWQVEDLSAYPEIPSPEETGSTFLENAGIKAIAASQLFPGMVLADDSGLEVDALQGAPGVRSARYAGEAATDADNRALLLAELRRVGAEESPARFLCAMVLARGGEVLGRFTGAVEGRVVSRESGRGGFGYDSMFIPAGEEKSFGELPAEAKNAISHRARALGEVVAFLRNDHAL